MNAPTLSQPQREALINILVLGMYADGHLSLAESESMDGLLDALGWESGTGRTVFFADAITRVSAIANDTDLADFIERNASVFRSAEAKAETLGSLTKFLQVDGTVEAEAPLLSRINAALSA